jgi:hypothetical protein
VHGTAEPTDTNESAPDATAAIGVPTAGDATAGDPTTATVAPGPATTPDPEQGPTATGNAVEHLFAKLRAGRAAVTAEAKAESEEEGSGGEHAASTNGLSQSDTDESLLQKRESAVVDLEVALTRKLKRALQDEQNDLLDRLRGLRGEPSPDRLLPDMFDQVARFADTAGPLAEQAAAAGAAFARDTLGDKSLANDAPPEVTDLANEAANDIVEPLRRRLEQAINSSTDEDQSVLVESFGAAYREWKGQRIERVAGDLLTAAFSRGTWHASPAGTEMRWIVEDTDGPCPDCDDDALAGAVPKTEAFPTGQHHPPAHSGCRCLLVPASPVG